MHVEMTTGRRIVPQAEGTNLPQRDKRHWGENGAVLLAQCCWLSPELVAQIELDEQKSIIFAIRSSLNCALTRIQRMCAGRPVPELRE